MRQFSESEAEEIIGEIVRLRRVDASVVDKTIAEFYERTQQSVSQSRGGLEFAEELLQASFGTERAAGFLDRVSSTMAGTSFEFLDAADPHQVSSLLAGELPETTALVLAHLTPSKASQVLGKLEAPAQLDVAQAIASMRAATPEAVSIVADSLRRSRAIGRRSTRARRGRRRRPAPGRHHQPRGCRHGARTARSPRRARSEARRRGARAHDHVRRHHPARSQRRAAGVARDRRGDAGDRAQGRRTRTVGHRAREHL